MVPSGCFFSSAVQFLAMHFRKSQTNESNCLKNHGRVKFNFLQYISENLKLLKAIAWLITDGWVFYPYENCPPCHLLVRMRRGIFVQNNILQFLFCGCSMIHVSLTWQQWYVCLYHLLACAALKISFALSLPPKPMTGEGCGGSGCRWLPATKCGDQLSLQPS